MTTRSGRDVASDARHVANVPLPMPGVAAWLHGTEARSLDDAGLLASLGRRLQTAGLGFDRLVFHVGTLHPEVFARILAFAPHQPVEIYERDDPATVAAGFPGSPFREAAMLRTKVIVRTADAQFLGRAAGSLLQSRGVGEIVSTPFDDRQGRTIIVSFCAARPNIFSAADHLIIDGVIVSLRQNGRRPGNRIGGNTTSLCCLCAASRGSQ
jgi:hypothetical protein